MNIIKHIFFKNKKIILTLLCIILITSIFITYHYLTSDLPKKDMLDNIFEKTSYVYVVILFISFFEFFYNFNNYLNKKDSFLSLVPLRGGKILMAFLTSCFIEFGLLTLIYGAFWSIINKGDFQIGINGVEGLNKITEPIFSFFFISSGNLILISIVPLALTIQKLINWKGRFIIGLFTAIGAGYILMKGLVYINTSTDDLTLKSGIISILWMFGLLGVIVWMIDYLIEKKINF